MGGSVYMALVEPGEIEAVARRAREKMERGRPRVFLSRAEKYAVRIEAGRRQEQPPSIMAAVAQAVADGFGPGAAVSSLPAVREWARAKVEAEVRYITGEDISLMEVLSDWWWEHVVCRGARKRYAAAMQRQREVASNLAARVTL